MNLVLDASTMVLAFVLGIVLLALVTGSKNPKWFCLWTYNKESSHWIGNCGIHWSASSTEFPRNSGFNYCPRCGKLTKENKEQES